MIDTAIDATVRGESKTCLVIGGCVAVRGGQAGGEILGDSSVQSAIGDRSGQMVSSRARRRRFMMRWVRRSVRRWSG